jgi:hypothetical protein
MLVAVTGAGGFVGSAVCADLEAAGHRIVRLARRPIERNPDTVLWDLRRGRKAVAPPPAVDAVVHCAAAISTFDADGTAREANLGGSLRVVAAWPGTPIVYVSSASVYPPSRMAKGGRPLREDDATGVGLHDPYSRQTRGRAGARGRGGGDREGADDPAAEHRLWAGRPAPPSDHSPASVRRLVLLPGGRLPWSLTPIGLLCDAVRASVERPAAGIRTVNVAEDPPERVRDLFLRLLSAEAGRPLRAVPFPAWPVSAYAWCVEAAWRVLHLRSEPVVTRSAVAYIREERVLDLTALAGQVGEASDSRA